MLGIDLKTLGWKIATATLALIVAKKFKLF